MSTLKDVVSALKEVLLLTDKVDRAGKMLSEMAIHDPEGFDQVVETAQKAVANST